MQNQLDQRSPNQNG